MGGKVRLLFKYWLLCCLSLGFVLLTLGTSGSVQAQEEDVEEFMLEEVVVTAEKREAELQKIPMDIAVVRPDDMEILNIHQVEDIDKLMPDMSIINFASGMLTISIRDVETQYWNPTSEATVAVHLDGVQLTRSTGLEGKLYDLERVETLKGPQGTLYGRGATAGSMNIISKKPDIGEFGGNISVEYGSYNRRRLEGALNIPATEKLAFRLSGNSLTRDGYDDANLGNQDMWGVRAQMRWEPTDTQSLVIAVDRDRTDNKGGYSTGVYLDTFGDVEIVRNPALDIIDPTDPNYIREEMRPYLQGGPVMARFEDDWFISDAALDQFNRNNSWGIKATYDKEFDFAWLTVEYGYRTMREHKSFVMNGTPGLQPLGAYLSSMQFGDSTYNPETGVYAPPNYMIFNMGPYGTLTPTDGASIMNSYSYDGTVPVTQLIVAPSTYDSVRVTLDYTWSRMYQGEARLASNATVADGDKYEWLAGTMYMHDYVYERARIFENVDNQVLLREYAVFGQASWAPFANINFTGGYRYTWDTKTFYGNMTSDDHGYGNPADWWERYPMDQTEEVFGLTEAKWNFSTYKANISWQATDDIMPYIQYSKGVKTGNVDRTGHFIEPETLDSYEIGLRSRLFNGKLQVNATAYRYDYNNYNEWHTVYGCKYGQNPDSLGTCLNASGASSPITNADYTRNIYTVLNVGAAKQEGANINAVWMATASDSFTLNGSWSTNRRKGFDVANAMRAYAESMGFIADSADQPQYDSDTRNNERFGSRAVKGYVGYTRTMWFGKDLLTFNTMGFYQGKGRDQIMRQGRDDEFLMPGSPDYWTFDASISYTSSWGMPEGTQANLRVYANNVFDRDHLSSRNYSDYMTFNGVRVFDPGNGTVSGSYIDPRTIGIVFGVNF